VLLLFWIAKVIPSAIGFDNWKVKSVVKACTFTGVTYHAEDASFCPPSVNCSRESSSCAFPFSTIWPADAAKPCG